MTDQPSDDIEQRLHDALNAGSERAAEEKATAKAARRVADAAKKQKT